MFLILQCQCPFVQCRIYSIFKIDMPLVVLCRKRERERKKNPERGSEREVGGGGGGGGGGLEKKWFFNQHPKPSACSTFRMVSG